jgi:hypothetical protein
MGFRWLRWILLVIVIFGIALGVPAIRRPLLRAAGEALVVDEPVEPSDVIVVPQWAGAAGAIDAADLVHHGIAGHVAVLPGPSGPAHQELARRGIAYTDESAHIVQLLGSLGVAMIEVIPNAASGTDAEGSVLPSWCDQHQFRSIVVVSLPDHSRRVRRVLHRSFLGHPTRVVVRSARYSSFDSNGWWKTRDGIRTEIMELEKLSLDIARHPIS